MVGFDYKFNTLSDIINNIKLLSEFSMIEFSILAGGLLLFILIILYFIPLMSITFSYIKKYFDKERKKEMIKQIAMQKDINDEIEKELNI